MAHGQVSSPRNRTTREIVGLKIIVERPEFCGVSRTGRGGNQAIGVLEATQLIAGEATPQLMAKITSGKFEEFMDGEVLHGSYGPRIRPQMETLFRRLTSDADSRQGVITIWDPLYDSQERRDIPCTVALQFLLRNDALTLCVTMRSNDGWLGFPYDIFQFSQLQLTVAHCLGVAPGQLHHSVGSFHLYEQDWEKVDKVMSVTGGEPDVWLGAYEYNKHLTAYDSFLYAQLLATYALKGDPRYCVSRLLKTAAICAGG